MAYRPVSRGAPLRAHPEHGSPGSQRPGQSLHLRADLHRFHQDRFRPFWRGGEPTHFDHPLILHVQDQPWLWRKPRVGIGFLAIVVDTEFLQVEQKLEKIAAALNLAFSNFVLRNVVSAS